MKAKLINESIDKITTEDCINAIIDYLSEKGDSEDNLNPKNWKRKSKFGSDGLYTRIFVNLKIKNGKAFYVDVIASDNEILEIKGPYYYQPKIKK